MRTIRIGSMVAVRAKEAVVLVVTAAALWQRYEKVN